MIADAVPDDERPILWQLQIVRANNGYVLRGIFGDNPIPGEYVIQEDERDELKAHEELLWEVMEYFNFGGSKHDKERLRVTREKQEG